MKLNNRDLVLRGLLGVLPPHLERYLRATLGNRCTPQRLRLLLGGNGSGSASDLPDLADLSTQIRILTARGTDGRHLLTLPRSLGSKLHEVRHVRNEAVHGGAFDADKTLAALVAANEVLRLIGAESGRAEIRELIAAIDSGRGTGGDPLDAVGIEVECVPVISYAHAVAGAAPMVSVRLSLAEGPGLREAGSNSPMLTADDQQRQTLIFGARGSRAMPPGPLEVALTIIEDDGGRQVVEPWHLTWDTSHPVLRATCAMALDRASLRQIDQSGSAHVRVELRVAAREPVVRRLPGLAVLSPRQWRFAGGGCWAGAALATFVQPDQVVVGALAAEALRLAPPDENAGPADPAGSPGPDALAAAACTALRRRRIAIESVEPGDDRSSWQAAPQPIRTAARLLDARAGSVLDVAVLLAGILERLGMAGTLLLTSRTVLVGYRRREQGGGAPTSPQEAADLIRRGVMGMIDSDLAVSASVASLHELPDTARSAALEVLPDLALAVPVGSARADGTSSQPMLERDEDDVVHELDASAGPGAPGAEPSAAPEPAVVPDTGWLPDDDGPASDSDSAPGSDSDSGPEPEPTSAVEVLPAPAAAPAGAELEPAPAAAEALPAPPAAVENWKRSLLDLSRRNPLISRTSRDTVKLWVPPDLIGRL